MKKRRKIEEKTTTYTASDLPEEIHSEEPVKDAEIVKNAETESETTESEIVESGSTESEVAESAVDTEVKDSESATEISKAEDLGENETTIETAIDPATETATEDDSEESEKGGFTRGKLIKIFAMEVLAFVIFIFAIIAWFSMNEEVSATGMQIRISTPAGIYISLGARESTGDSSPVYSLKLESGAVVEPEESDWLNEIEIDDYYTFGKLIPASSVSGKEIYFTPDATTLGRTVKSEARYFQATGFTDGNLQYYITSEASGTPSANSTSGDNDSLAATAHVYTSEEAADKDNAWPGYSRKEAWNDTNDDGYYVDIPLWIRTTGTEAVELKVIGITRPGIKPVGTVESGTEPLYKSTRVALMLDEDGQELEPLGSGTAPDIKSILSLKAASTFDNYATADVILDSENYTVREQETSGTLWAVSSVSGTTGTYSEYEPYQPDSPDDEIILTLGGTGNSQEKKIWIRVWLDGEDLGCWNPNAGQDWIIDLKFLNADDSV